MAAIVPVAKEDLPTLGDFVHDSKQALTINRLLFTNWPDEANQRPVYTSSVYTSFDDPNCQLFKAVVDGEAVGHVVLSKREAVRAPPTEQPPSDDGVPTGMNPSVFNAVIKTVTELNKSFSGDRLELTHIYVKHPFRRQRIGSQMVKLCMDKARDQGLPLVVQSEPEAHAFLVKQGFHDVNSADFDLTEWAQPYSGYGLFRLCAMIANDH